MGWELAGKAVLVTGGASGIGLACVRAFRAARKPFRSEAAS